MDESVLIVEMPELSNESVFALCEFLHALTASFESHYDRQLRECYRQREQEYYQQWQEQGRSQQSDPFDDEIPF
jgi:hypothetical protein